MWYHQQLWTMNQYQKRNPQKQHFTRMILNWLACKFAMTWNKNICLKLFFHFLSIKQIIVIVSVSSFIQIFSGLNRIACARPCLKKITDSLTVGNKVVLDVFFGFDQNFVLFVSSTWCRVVYNATTQTKTKNHMPKEKKTCPSP
jgi:hypothetical protein